MLSFAPHKGEADMRGQNAQANVSTTQSGCAGLGGGNVIFFINPNPLYRLRLYKGLKYCYAFGIFINSYYRIVLPGQIPILL